MKRIVAFVFLLAFTTQAFSRSFIVLDYFINTGSFAKKCVNKARPKMHCNGKCQMMKTLRQEEKKDQQFPERKAGNKSEVFSSRSFFFLLNINPLLIQKIYSINTAPGLSDQAFPVFHPPQV